MSRSARSYLLLSAFIRALSHQVRTSLSVISNDLSYFRGMLPEGECDRALERCRQIAELLRNHSLPELDVKEAQALTVPQIIRDILPDWIAACDLDLFPEKAARISDVDLLRVGFEALERVLRDLPGLGVVDKDVDLRAALELETDKNLFLVNYSMPLLAAAEQEKHFDSISAVLVNELRLDLSEAPLIDAIFDACECGIETGIGDRITLKIAIPLLES